MKRILLVWLALLLPPFLPLPAHADGMFVWRNREADITEPEQKAVVIYDRGWEDLILEVKYDGPAREFGWVVPLPSTPELTPAKAELFEDLSRRTQERRFGMSPRRMQWGALSGLATSVEVLDRRRVGVYDTAILASRSAEALYEWLKTNEFRLPPGAGPVLDEYIRKSWIFVAMKIAPGMADSAADRALASGTIQPIRFRFRAVEPVFPLRISSVNGGASDVLLYVLADDHYVNRTCRGGHWDTMICGPLSKLEYIDPDSVHAPDGHPGFFVTKLRAHVRAGQMEDVLFSVYDPMPALGSLDAGLRAEAASYIGWKGLEAGVGPLVAFLDRARPSGLQWIDNPGVSASAGQDVISAAWALGRIGSREAIDCLLRLADGPPSPLTYEALNGLARLKVREALPRFVAGLDPGSDDRDGIAWEIRELALETIVEQGDITCLPGLRSLRPPPGRAGRRENVPGATPGAAEIMAALAACGDSVSRRTILDEIVSGSTVTAPDQLQSRAVRDGSYNGYPYGVWIGTALIIDYPDPSPSEWPALYNCVTLLKRRPGLMDSLLRRAAQDPRVPDPGKALLLGCLRNPEGRDRAALDRLWTRALAPGATIARVRVDSSPGDTLIESYNLSTCPVVYAYTSWRDAPSLRRLWDSSPGEGDATRAEIALGLARCGQPEDIERVSAYVARYWGKRAAALDLRHLAMQNPPWRFGVFQLQRWLDADYRVSPILGYFKQVAGGSSAVERLVSDSWLHPLVRLQFALVAIEDRRFSEPMLARVRETLDQIEPRTTSDPLWNLVNAARRQLDGRMGKQLDRG